MYIEKYNQTRRKYDKTISIHYNLCRRLSARLQQLQLLQSCAKPLIYYVLVYLGLRNKWIPNYALVYLDLRNQRIPNHTLVYLGLRNKGIPYYKLVYLGLRNKRIPNYTLVYLGLRNKRISNYTLVYLGLRNKRIPGELAIVRAVLYCTRFVATPTLDWRHHLTVIIHDDLIT